MKVSEAIKRAGSVIRLAEMLGVHRQAVYKWKWNGDKFPDHRVDEVNKLLGDA